MTVLSIYRRPFFGGVKSYPPELHVALQFNSSFSPFFAFLLELLFFLNTSFVSGLSCGLFWFRSFLVSFLLKPDSDGDILRPQTTRSLPCLRTFNGMTWNLPSLAIIA